MKKTFPALSLALILAAVAPILHAEGNRHAGKEKTAACASCHGEDGNSPVATFPKLAEQHATYLIQQLQAFKNGTRKDAMMSPMAMGLSNDDIADIAAYYAEETVTHNALPTPKNDDDDDESAPAAKKSVQELIALGSDLYRNGDLSREVSACIACHGPTGTGNRPAAFPLLKSQHADYLIKTLNDFKSGARGNTPENIMHMIAKKMTAEEIEAVAYRISMMR